MFLGAQVAFATTSEWIRIPLKPAVVAESFQLSGYSVPCQQWMRNAPLENPRCIDGLQRWFDASDADTITKAGSGSVSAWADKSGGGNDLAMATESLKPLWVDAVQNGKPVLRFNGTDDRLDGVNTGVTGLAGITVFAVASRDATSGFDTIISIDRSTQRSWWLGGNTSTQASFGVSTDGSALDLNAAVAMTNGMFRVFMGTYDNETAIIDWDNTTDSSTAPSGDLFTSTSVLSVGANFINASPWDGDIAEILIYDRVLTSDEQLEVKAYLQSKWLEIPNQISGLRLWLDASDGSTMTESGSTIATWADKSGAGNHVTQVTTANEPTHNSNKVTFDSDDCLTGPGTDWQSSSAFTVFLVAERSAYASNPAAYVLGNGNSTTGLFVLYPFDNYLGNGVRTFFSGTDVNQNSGAASAGSPHLYTAAVRSATDREMYVDSASVGTATLTRTLASSLTTRIGCWYVGSGQHHNGDIYEVLSYNRSLSDAERQEVEAYLNAKWGL